MHTGTPTRRRFIAAGGTGAAAIAALATGKAKAAELTATEKANVAVVDAFHKTMSDPTPSLDKLGRLKETCSDNIIWGTAGGMKLHGLPAVVDWYTNFLKPANSAGDGLRTMQYEYSETFAHGPVVVEYGLHFVIPPGGPKPAPTNFHCVVHIVKDGKIIERYDNSVR
jgi:hypothetical protein